MEKKKRGRAGGGEGVGVKNPECGTKQGTYPCTAEMRDGGEREKKRRRTNYWSASCIMIKRKGKKKKSQKAQRKGVFFPRVPVSLRKKQLMSEYDELLFSIAFFFCVHY